MASLREILYPETSTTARIELREKHGEFYALGGKIYPHSLRSEDGKRILGKVLWNSSLTSYQFWRVYGDGISDCFEKVDGQWPLFDNAHLIPDHIEIVAVNSDEAADYFGEPVDPNAVFVHPEGWEPR